ncbi:MAG: NAD-dependent epimerase/dehydratase family protein [Patescibacteria group bacterium]
MFKDKKVLVTGGTGFIGINLIKKLIKKGVKVRATLYRKDPVILDSRIEYVKADLSKWEDCQKTVADTDYVFMCASISSGAAVIQKTPMIHVTPNDAMNAFMLKAAYEARVKKFLWISSCTIYPLSAHPLKEDEDRNGPLFEKYYFVGTMKRYIEDLCRMYAEKIKNTMPVVVVRPTSVYGPHDDFNWESSHVIPALIRKVVERHDPVEVWGDGTAIKDLIFVEDMVDGILLAMEKINTFMPINLGSGKQTSIREIADSIIKTDGYQNAKIVFDPSKPTMLPKMLIDVSRAKKFLGFTAKTGVEDGIRKTIEWYRDTRSDIGK